MSSDHERTQQGYGEPQYGASFSIVVLQCCVTVLRLIIIAVLSTVLVAAVAIPPSYVRFGREVHR